MSEEKDKLLNIMSSLEADYKAGKISREKYSYFRSKYEDKLTSIEAVEATNRIRSMQGKPRSNTQNKRRSRKPTKNKKQEQDLVQKYIINPKKDDAKYNKKQKSSVNSNGFKLIVILVLIVAFTAGVAYGIFNLDSETGTNTDVVAIVEDTAFPEINAVIPNVTTNVTDTNNTVVDDDKDNEDNDNNDEEVETTTETVRETTVETTSEPSQSSSSDSGSSSSSSSDSGSSSSSSSEGGSSDSSEE